MPRPESAPIGAIDDVAAALSHIRESVGILAARWRGRFGRADLDELNRVLSMCEAIQEYHQLIRAPLSAQYQKREMQ